LKVETARQTVVRVDNTKLLQRRRRWH